MALTFNHLRANRKTFSGKAAIWVSTSLGASPIKLSESAELTITPETSESEAVNNRGHGRFDDVVKNYIIEGKFVERGEDVRQIFTDDADQSMRGKYYTLWIQGAELETTGGGVVYEQWAFPYAKLKRNFKGYALGSGDPMISFSFYAEANDSCATVTITAPTGDPCYAGADDDTLTVADGEFHATADVSAT